MATTEVIKPKVGEAVHRMSNDKLQDNETKEELPNTSGNVVNFKVEYPKEFKGTKYMKEGDIHKLHVVHAKALEEKGLGKIQK